MSKLAEAQERLTRHYLERVQVAEEKQDYLGLDDDWLQIDAMLKYAASRSDDTGVGLLSRVTLALNNYWNVRGMVHERVTWCRESIKACNATDRYREKGAHIGNLGAAFHQLHQYDKAIEHSKQALAIACENGDRHGEGRYLGDLGTAYWALGRNEEAIECYKQALDIAHEVGDRYSEGITLGGLGNVYQSLWRYEEAIDHYKQALGIAREIGDRYNEGTILGGLSVACSQLEQGAQAIEYYKQALTIAREIGNRRNEGIILHGLGVVYSQLGQPEQAIGYYEQALDIARRIGDRNFESDTLNSLGVAYFNLRRIEQAIEYHKQSLNIAREIDYHSVEGSALGNLGNICYIREQYEQAINHYEQALSVAREIGDRNTESTWLNNLGQTYSDLGQYDQAIEYYEQAVVILEEINPPAAEPIRSYVEKLLLLRPTKRLRSSPVLSLTEAEVLRMIKERDFYDSRRNDNGKGINHRYELVERHGETLVIDHATLLTWQQFGSDSVVSYDQAQEYIRHLNRRFLRRPFGGYNDWRLPTVEEAMSLVEEGKKRSNSGPLTYIGLPFGDGGRIWTSDKQKSSAIWIVCYNLGYCTAVGLHVGCCVRAVRSGT